MGDDFIKVVVEPRAGMSDDWQTYRPKPAATTVRARRMNHDFTIDGQDVGGKAGDYLVNSAVTKNGVQLGVMTPEQFAESFSAVRGPRPAKPKPAETAAASSE